MACTPALRYPTSTNLRSAEKLGIQTTLEELEHGRRLYVRSCGGCHALRLAEDYTPEKWQRIAPAMAKKAKISNEDAYLIFAYLRTSSDAAK